MARELTAEEVWAVFGWTTSPSEGSTELKSTTSAMMWEKALDHILALVRLEDNWDGEGAPRVRPDLIRSALRLACQMMEADYPAPHDVYPMPDGNITLEW